MSGEQAGSTSEAPLLFFRAYSALECGAFIRRRSWDEKIYLFLAHPVLRAEDLGGPDALLPTERAFTIVGRNQVLLNGAWIGAYNNTAGFFPGERGIFVEYRLTPPGNPALVLHELGHFWLHDRARVTQASAADVGAPWFNEGAVSLLPLSLLQAGLLPLTPTEAATIGVHWGLGDVPLRIDAPIEEDLRPRGGAHLLLFYQKSFLSQILLARAVGPARYRSLLHAVTQGIEQLHNTGELMAVLQQQAQGGAGALRPLLRGWVFAGPYGPLSPDAFRGARVAPDGTPRLPAAPGPDATPDRARE